MDLAATTHTLKGKGDCIESAQIAIYYKCWLQLAVRRLLSIKLQRENL